jgi:hypothetical protein
LALVSDPAACKARLAELDAKMKAVTAAEQKLAEDRAEFERSKGPALAEIEEKRTAAVSMWERATRKEYELESREELCKTREDECGLTVARQPIKVGSTLTTGPNPLAMAQAYFRLHQRSQVDEPGVPIEMPDDNPTYSGNTISDERYANTSLTRAVDASVPRTAVHSRPRNRRRSRVGA